MPHRARREPRWLTRAVVAAIHEAQIREHGGSFGVRDEGLLESALYRPRHKLAYEPGSTLAELAAAYGFGLAKNHAFVDGNKRVAFMAAYAFLGLNGSDLDVAEADAVSTFEQLAAGEITEQALADWLVAGMRPIRQRLR